MGYGRGPTLTATSAAFQPFLRATSETKSQAAALALQLPLAWTLLADEPIQGNVIDITIESRQRRLRSKLGLKTSGRRHTSSTAIASTNVTCIFNHVRLLVSQVLDCISYRFSKSLSIKISASTSVRPVFSFVRWKLNGSKFSARSSTASQSFGLCS